MSEQEMPEQEQPEQPEQEQLDPAEHPGITVVFAGPTDVRFQVNYVGTVHAGQISAAATYLQGYADFLSARAIMAQAAQAAKEQAARQQVAQMINSGGPIIQ